MAIRWCKCRFRVLLLGSKSFESLKILTQRRKGAKKQKKKKSVKHCLGNILRSFFLLLIFLCAFALKFLGLMTSQGCYCRFFFVFNWKRGCRANLHDVETA
jgi:hypothetical protein